MIQYRKEMNKITIEITATGWTTTVSINGETFSEKTERTFTGAKSVEGKLEGVEQIPDEVIDAIQSSAYYDCMAALRDIE